MVGTPLPDLPSRLQDSGSRLILSAYPKVLQVERNERASIKLRDHARILGYLILEGPSEIARENVAREVDSCCSDEILSNLGQFYFDHFIRACKLSFCLFKFFRILKISSKVKTNKGRTPTPSSHASRPSFDTLKEMIKAMVVEAPQNHQQAKKNVSALSCIFGSVQIFPFKALVRDGFRCVISGRYDIPSVKGNEEMKNNLKEVLFCTTQCAHIFPESTNANISGTGNASEHKV
jgi:hypothetical protein